MHYFYDEEDKERILKEIADDALEVLDEYTSDTEPSRPKLKVECAALLVIANSLRSISETLKSIDEKIT